MSTTIERQTYTIAEAAKLLGIGERAAHGQILRTGELAGVRAIRPTPRRVVIPKAAFDRVLHGEELGNDHQE